MNYWDLLEQGYTVEQIRNLLSGDLEKLASCGGFYTLSHFQKYTKCSRAFALKHFKSCYDPVFLQDQINFLIDQNPTISISEIVTYLNGKTFFSKTGKPWTISNFLSSGFITSKRKQKNFIHQRHLDLWKMFNRNKEKFSSYNQAVKFFNSIGYYQESGEPWSRQLLSLIIQKYPELDWSLPNPRRNQYQVLLEQYSHLNSDLLNSYSSFDEMVQDLDLPTSPAMTKVLSTFKISKKYWQLKKDDEIKKLIIDCIDSKPESSYIEIWDYVSSFGHFNSLAKRKSQRMYNYMKAKNLLEYKRSANEQ